MIGIKKKVLKIILQHSKLGSEGFGPTKDEPTDLQSAPFDHSGNSPKVIKTKKAATGTRTLDPEITNHVLYQLSYSGKC